VAGDDMRWPMRTAGQAELLSCFATNVALLKGSQKGVPLDLKVRKSRGRLGGRLLPFSLDGPPLWALRCVTIGCCNGPYF